MVISQSDSVSTEQHAVIKILRIDERLNSRLRIVIDIDPDDDQVLRSKLLLQFTEVRSLRTTNPSGIAPKAQNNRFPEQ